MVIAKWLIKIGEWLNKRFPEKMTADEVKIHFEKSAKAYSDHQEEIVSLRTCIKNMSQSIRELEDAKKVFFDRLELQHDEISKLQSDMNHAKIQIKMRTTRVPDWSVTEKK